MKRRLEYWQVSAAAVLALVLMACGTLRAQDSPPPPQSFSVIGVVRSGNSAIPGATVTATNPATGQRVITWSDADGSYALQVPAEGPYSVRFEMAGFAPGTLEVTVNGPSTRADLALVLLSRAQPLPAQPSPAQSARNGSSNAQPTHTPQATRSQPRTGAGNRGFQSLAVVQGDTGDAANASDQVVPPGMPVPGIAPDAATESVAVSGNSSSVSMFAASSDELQQRMRDSRDQGGGFGGGPGGGGPPGGGFGGGPRGAGGAFPLGGRGRFDINKPHGTVYYTVGNDALNSAPYSLTGQPPTKPSYLQNRFGASIGGPLNIPKIYNGGSKTFFFINYNGSRGENPFDAFSTVPTAAERAGDFSNSTFLTHDSNGNLVRLPVQIFYPNISTCPQAGQPIPGNNLQNSVAGCPQISSIAQGLLKFIPLPDPNLPGDVQNFHLVTSAVNNSDDLNIRLNRALGGTTGGRRAGGQGRGGPRNNLSIGFHYHQSSANLTNPFPSVGGKTSVRSFDVPVAYTRSFGKLTNTVRADFNRNRTSTQNLYAFTQNVAGDLGIGGVSQDPFDWGIPNLSFSDFGSLTDTNPQLLRNQTLTFSDNVIWNHGKHTFRWGGDFRRIQINTQASYDARGTFTFTGLNTSQLGAPNTGFDFADFLLGLPQQTQLQCGVATAGSTQCIASNYHFRGNSWDLYVQDEWKLRANFTLNFGLRYEYVSPFSEVSDRIANLILSPGVLNPAFGNPTVNLVQPGQSYPDSLVHPDRNNFAPRVGIAWKALPKTVVRAGYGINYNTGAYQTIAQQLAFQPPFAITETNVQLLPGDLTLQGFPPPPQGQISNNYAVDPNYRLGYVQIWNFDVQQEITPTLMLNLDYTGTKGTRLDILEDPNRDQNGVRIAGVQAFNWETSQGDSLANAGSIRVRKRLQRGVSIGGTYTYSKSIDNASSIGGGTAVVAQNAFDLAAERGLSSFDQRHKFTADYLWELPFGHDRRWLIQNGPLRAVFGDWQWSGDWTIASGTPFTPRLLGDFSDVSRGTNGTLRADVVPGQLVSISDPSIAEWFNTAAFVAPPPGQFGNARRNSIIGPGTKLFDMAFTKVFPLKESRMLEVRAQVSNVFNTPQFTAISTVVNSPTFGQVISVGAMRTIQLTARFRF